MELGGVFFPQKFSNLEHLAILETIAISETYWHEDSICWFELNTFNLQRNV